MSHNEATQRLSAHKLKQTRETQYKIRHISPIIHNGSIKTSHNCYICTIFVIFSLLPLAPNPDCKVGQFWRDLGAGLFGWCGFLCCVVRIWLGAVRISVGAVRTWYTFLQYVQPFRGLAANEHLNERTEHMLMFSPQQLLRLRHRYKASSSHW